MSVVLAIYKAPYFNTLPSSSSKESAADLSLERQIQRHFLAYNIYIPIEDIVTLPSTNGSQNEVASLIMQKACGRGRLFVWIPFKFRLPVTGEKVIEWCWKPQTKEA